MTLTEEIVDRWMIDTAGHNHLMLLVNDSLFDLTRDQALAIRDSLARHIDELGDVDQEPGDSDSPVSVNDIRAVAPRAGTAWNKLAADYLCSTDPNMVAPATSNERSRYHDDVGALFARTKDEEEQLMEEWVSAGSERNDAQQNYEKFQSQLKTKS